MIIDKQFENDKLILVAVGKLFSDQACYLLDKFNQRAKFDFKLAINSVDRFTNDIEAKLSNEDKELMQVITDTFNNALAEMRAETKKLV